MEIYKGWDLERMFEEDMTAFNMRLELGSFVEGSSLIVYVLGRRLSLASLVLVVIMLLKHNTKLPNLNL